MMKYCYGIGTFGIAVVFGLEACAAAVSLSTAKFIKLHKCCCHRGKYKSPRMAISGHDVTRAISNSRKRGKFLFGCSQLNDSHWDAIS